MPHPTNCPNTARLGGTMSEFYAKIVPLHKGSFKYCATVWKSSDGIDSIWHTKKFISINSARRWAEKNITKAVSQNSHTLFIKESDILRRKWNDQ